MDAKSAEVLRRRLEQQAHWRQADAVVDGRQPATDPDAEQLVELGDGLRIYESRRRTHEGYGRICKRLVNGLWQSDLHLDGVGRVA